MIKVLFVCLGNIGRSPLAEALFNHKIAASGIASKFVVDSCGTGNYHIGSQPDSRSIQVAHRHKVFINHACRQLTKTDLDEFDYLLAMDKSNQANILSLSKNSNHKEKVLLMRSFDTLDKHDEVPDPYYGGENEFQAVYDILDHSVDGFISFLKRKHDF